MISALNDPRPRTRLCRASRWRQAIIAASLLLVSGVRAEVRLPALFSPHAVVQKSAQTAVWGMAAPGENITVTFGSASARTTAGLEGHWRAVLDLSAAGAEPRELIVEGSNRLTVSDVVAGEVWLSSGQSNMQFPLNGTEGWAEEAARSTNPSLRWFLAESGTQFLEPQEEVRGKWLVSGPDTAGACSGVAYYFGKKLQADLKTPMGLILTAAGGTIIQCWMSPAAIAADPALVPDGKPKKPRPHQIPSFHFNQLIHPLAGLSLRGVIWYQGEAHFSEGEWYRRAFLALIRDWRREFAQPEMPFYFCQLPNLDQPTLGAGDAGWVAGLREAQDAALLEPHTGEAVLIDSGGVDLHPRNKKIVGERLAVLAEADTYRLPVAAHSPRPTEVTLEAGRMRIRFEHCPGGLVARPLSAGVKPNPTATGSEVQGFALSGTDGKWVWAQARISGDTVEVWSPEVPAPVEVRYAWSNNPVCNLTNRDGFPAGPFQRRRSDAVDHQLPQ